MPVTHETDANIVEGIPVDASVDSTKDQAATVAEVSSKQDTLQLKTMMQNVLERVNNLPSQSPTSSRERSSRIEIEQLQRDIVSIRRSLQDVQHQLDHRVNHLQQQQYRQPLQQQDVPSTTHISQDIKLELAQIKGMLFGLRQPASVQYVAQQPVDSMPSTASHHQHHVYSNSNVNGRETQSNAIVQDVVNKKSRSPEQISQSTAQRSQENGFDEFDAASAEYARQQYNSIIGTRRQEHEKNESERHTTRMTPLASETAQRALDKAIESSITHRYNEYTNSILGTDPDDQSNPKQTGDTASHNIETHYILDEKEESNEAHSLSDDGDNGDDTASDVSFEDLFQKAMDAKHLNPFSSEFKYEPDNNLQEDYSYTPGSLKSSLDVYRPEQEENSEEKLADIRRKTELARNSDSRLKNLKLFKFVDRLTSGSLDLDGNNVKANNSGHGDTFANIYRNVDFDKQKTTDQEPIPDRKSVIEEPSNTLTLDSVIADIEKTATSAPMKQQQLSATDGPVESLSEQFEHFDFQSDERYRRFIAFCEDNGTLDNIDDSRREFAVLKLKAKFYTKYVEGAEKFDFYAYCSARGIREPEEELESEPETGKVEALENIETERTKNVNDHQTVHEQQDERASIAETEEPMQSATEQDTVEEPNQGASEKEITEESKEDAIEQDDFQLQQEQSDMQTPSEQDTRKQDHIPITIKPSKKSRKPKPWELRRQQVENIS